jgi:hypothetical protein
LRISWRRGVKQRRVMVGWTGLSTKAKSEAAEARVTIPLLHRSINIKANDPFFKGFNLRAFFSLRGNGRARGYKFK